jgi:rhodanese-related sulfurtransferase
VIVLVALAIYLLNRQAQSLQAQQPTQPVQAQQALQTQPAAPQVTPQAMPVGAIGLPQAFLIYQNGKAFFLDVRAPEDFALYRIPNSVSIPLAELETRTSEVPLDKDIVIVCMISDDCLRAQEILTNIGFTRLYPMTDGIENWVLQGYPFEGAFPD